VTLKLKSAARELLIEKEKKAKKVYYIWLEKYYDFILKLE